MHLSINKDSFLAKRIKGKANYNINHFYSEGNVVSTQQNRTIGSCPSAKIEKHKIIKTQILVASQTLILKQSS